MLFWQRNNEEDGLSITVLTTRNENRFFCQSPNNNQVNQRDLKVI